MISQKARTVLERIETDSSAEQDVGELLPLVYGELRGLAQRVFRRAGAAHTLQPTALVHEAYIRLVGKDALAWNSRTHFLNIAAKAMRQILVDHHRERGAQKRGGAYARVTLSGAALASSLPGVDAIALQDALKDLEARDARQCRVVELRFFAGLTMEEIARELDVSLTTVESEWRHARAWLHRKLVKSFP